MKIITQVVMLTLSLLQVNADNDQYCTNLIKSFKNNCNMSVVTIDSCCELKPFMVSGVFKLKKGSFDNSIHAYCDMVTADGGWIVIQRNKKDTSVTFNRNWTDYEEGFGDLNTEFWYGLEEIHCLTQNGQWEMRVDYQFTNNTWSYLHYNQFSVGSANKEYPLTVGGFTGVGTDWFNVKSHQHNGMKFSTSDNDNDNYKINCATRYESGWWHTDLCYFININKQPPHVHGDMLFSEMKIRPKDCITQ